MKIGIPKESLAGETRVACTPATVAQLQKLGFDVVVENGAGLGASFDDAAYEEAGATVAAAGRSVEMPADLQAERAERQRMPPSERRPDFGRLPLSEPKRRTG